MQAKLLVRDSGTSNFWTENLDRVPWALDGQLKLEIRFFLVSTTAYACQDLLRRLHFDLIYTVSQKKSSTSYFAEYFRAGLTDCKNVNGYRVRDNQ